MLATNQLSVQSPRTNTSLRVLDANIASIFGVNAAILINRLRYWIKHGYGVEYQGRRYIYNTYRQWVKHEFPWMTARQFQKIVYWLRDLEVLLIEQLRSQQYNQMNFYSLNEEKLQEYLVNSNSPGGELEDTKRGTDLYTNKTSIENGIEMEADSIEKSDGKTNQQNIESIETDKTQAKPETQAEPSAETDGKESNLPIFHHYLVNQLIDDPNINNPLAYAQKIIDNLRQGSASSQKLYEQWLENGECNLSSSELNPPQSSQNPPQTEQTEQPQETALREWQIKPDDTELLDFGYQVGDVYPEFVQWCVPRLKYHPDLSDYATKAHVIKKLKFEPQLALELWRDFKRLLVREYNDKQEMEQKGQRYFTPAWMQLPAEIPVEKAKEASMELNQAKAQEQRAINGQQSNNQLTLTAGNDEQEQTEETSASADSEDQNNQEELTPIESVKSAIALMEKHSNHPATKGIVQTIINGAKANASESELEEIQRLEDQAFEF
ncbi:MAG: hypothetical protein GVY04_00850 [Cyanobacteria bacterium]|jgi:hypothetical protein|nr:hypothetical protein [Cyanobacteria bacterium GSL.Bin1]